MINIFKLDYFDFINNEVIINDNIVEAIIVTITLPYALIFNSKNNLNETIKKVIIATIIQYLNCNGLVFISYFGSK